MTIATDNIGIGTDDDTNGDLVAGDDWEFAFRVSNLSGDEVDVSNAQEITWLLADSEYADTEHITKTQSGGGITVDDAGGSLSTNSRVVVSVSGSENEALGGDTYYQELEITDANGDKETAEKGPITPQDSPNDP